MAAAEHTFTVLELAELLREALTVTFPRDVWIEGEVRNMRRPASGHVYFDLVDGSTDHGRPPDAVLSIMLSRTTKQIINKQIRAAGGGLRIDDGVALRLRGAPDFYPPSGRLQLRMSGIDPAYTLGRMLAERDHLLRTLAAEQLLERNRALPLPRVPLRIGLVTAHASAARADFLDELRRSGLAWEVVHAITTVQGVSAASRIAAAIRRCEQAEVQVIALVRGGGARTDMVAFDHEVVARAIATCSVPILTGVGHEIDESVADTVAHSALKTPTACAAHLVERVLAADREATAHWTEIVARSRALVAAERVGLTGRAQRARRASELALTIADARAVSAAQTASRLVSRQLDRQHERMERAAAAVELQARHRVDRAAARLDDAVRRTRTQGRRHLTAADRTIATLDERRRLLDPARALARGWSITTDHEGRVVRSLADVDAGDRLFTRVADGIVHSTVDATPTDESTTPS